MSVFKWTKENSWIDIFINISLFLFLSSKTGVIKGSAMEYLSLAAFGLFLASKILKRGRMILTGQSVYYMIFSIYAVSSCLWAMNKSFSLEQIPSILALMIFLILLGNYADSYEQFLNVIHYTIINNIIVSFKILFLYYFYTGSPASRINEITGIYFNTVGQVLAFSILFSIYLYKLKNQKIYLLFCVPQFLAILFTESRKSIIIPVLGIIFIYLLEKRVMKRKTIYKFLVFVTVLLLLWIAVKSAGVEIFSESLKRRMEALIKSVTGQENDWSIYLRRFFINTGLNIFKEHPIYGIGVNNFAYYVKNFTDYTVARYSHNNYIEMLSCLGIIGFALYYWFYSSLMIKLIKNVIHNRTDSLFIIICSIMAVLMIMEWGVVSYTGCIYHIYIFFVYYTERHRLEIKQKEGGESYAEEISKI